MMSIPLSTDLTNPTHIHLPYISRYIGVGHSCDLGLSNSDSWMRSVGNCSSLLCLACRDCNKVLHDRSTLDILAQSDGLFDRSLGMADILVQITTSVRRLGNSGSSRCQIVDGVGVRRDGQEVGEDSRRRRRVGLGKHSGARYYEFK